MTEIRPEVVVIFLKTIFTSWPQLQVFAPPAMGEQNILSS